MTARLRPRHTSLAELGQGIAHPGQVVADRPVALAVEKPCCAQAGGEGVRRGAAGKPREETWVTVTSDGARFAGLVSAAPWQAPRHSPSRLSRSTGPTWRSWTTRRLLRMRRCLRTSSSTWRPSMCSRLRRSTGSVSCTRRALRGQALQAQHCRPALRRWHRVRRRKWIGQELRVGDDVVLEITDHCPRCVMTTLPQGDLPKDSGILRTAARHNDVHVGVYAEVRRGGTVRRGDGVTLR